MKLHEADYGYDNYSLLRETAREMFHDASILRRGEFRIGHHSQPAPRVL